MTHITLVAGTRPNFVKVSPIIRAIKNAAKKGNLKEYSLVHTGQHYDRSMSGSFFEDLEIPEPNVNLEVGSGSQAEQTAHIMIRFEEYLQKNSTNVVLVVGDVTSTMACSIVTKKLNIPLVHVEGGIRSFDMTMPEEINRRLTDSITDHFFTTSRYANENLIKEGNPKDKIHFVGNVMIDTLMYHLSELREPKISKQLGLQIRNYIILTLHRPTNVDDPEKLESILRTISKHCQNVPVIFPVHPRTRHVIEQSGISIQNLHLVEPLGYLEFNYLVKNSKAAITDSGGITEETTVLGIPCLTMRDNTERPETCIVGSNELIGSDPSKLPQALEKLFSGNWKKGSVPELWDGKSAERIIEKLLSIYGFSK
jgi:UDP-N-acetylglucosamine 2-epimerase (non-hydrolysing)